MQTNSSSIFTPIPSDTANVMKSLINILNKNPDNKQPCFNPTLTLKKSVDMLITLMQH